MIKVKVYNSLRDYVDNYELTDVATVVLGTWAWNGELNENEAIRESRHVEDKYGG